MKPLLQRLFNEPLVGFALAGGLLFGVYDLFRVEDKPQIVVTPAAVADLVDQRRLILDREILGAERDELISRYVDHEVLVSEAIARGLYRKDSRVRRRLADKMAFLLEEEPPEPTQAQLQALFDARRQDYVTPRAVSFEHVYFKQNRKAAAAVLPKLKAGEVQPDAVGDRFWLGRNMARYSAKQLLVVLGFEFDRTLKRLPIDEWHGPIRSGRGWHLVRLTARHEPRLLPDDELQRRLLTDWKQTWRERQRREGLAALRANYDVVLPQGDSVAATGQAGGG